jgi:hypothetical protein
MATLRTPLMKLRQVRNETKFYPTEEMGNSYLDHYPGIISVSSTYILFRSTFCLTLFIAELFLKITLIDIVDQITMILGKVLCVNSISVTHEQFCPTFYGMYYLSTSVFML